MIELKAKLKYSMPTTKAKKIWNSDPIKRRNKNLFQFKKPVGEIMQGFQTYAFTRNDLLTLMEKGNFKASDISEIIDKPLKTIKRWSNKNKDLNSSIPLSLNDYKKIYFKLDNQFASGLPMHIL